MKLDRTSVRQIFFVLRFTWKYKLHLFLLTVISIFELVIGLFIPLVTGLIVDDALLGQDLQLFKAFIVATILFFVIKVIGNATFMMLSNNYITQFSMAFQFYVLRCALRLRYGKMTEYSSAALITRIMDDTAAVTQYVSLLLPNLICLFINTLLLTIICLFFNVPITCGIFIIVPLHLLVANFWGKKITKLSLACKNISQLIYSTLVSYTKSIKMIKSNNLEYLVAKRYRFDWLRYVRESLKMRLGSQCSDNSQNIVLGAFFFSVYTYLLYQIVTGKYSVGFFIAYIAYIKSLSRNLGQYGSMYHSVLSILPSFKRVFEFLPDYENRQNLTASPSVKHRIDKTEYAIQIKNLFYASNKPLYKDLNLQIKTGNIVIITGANGIGKTTLLNLISGIIQPESGTIQIFGISVNHYTPDIMRDIISIVYCHDNSIDFIYKPYIVERQTHLFDIDHFFEDEDFPRKKLSTGEQYMNVFTQILKRHTPLILLDEPLANLDTFNKERLKEILLTNKNDTTFLITSHGWREFEDIADAIYELDHEQLQRLK